LFSAVKKMENGASAAEVASLPAPAAAAAATAATAAAAAAASRIPPSLEQCRVLQQVIRLLEHHDEAKKMLPLAAMSPEMLQTTLTKSAQTIKIADVLSKLMPHLDPAQAAQLWAQFRQGTQVAAAANGAGRVAAAAAAAAGGTAVNQAASVVPGAANPAHADVKRQPFAANNTKCGSCQETYHQSFSPLLLCDFCPGAYHVYCLGLDWQDLPEGEWACPQ
jgi:hypothetical protein